MNTPATTTCTNPVAIELDPTLARQQWAAELATLHADYAADAQQQAAWDYVAEGYGETAARHSAYAAALANGFDSDAAWTFADEQAATYNNGLVEL